MKKILRCSIPLASLAALCLSGQTFAATLIATCDPKAYVRSDGYSAVIVIGNENGGSNRVYEIYRDQPPGTLWHHNILPFGAAPLPNSAWAAGYVRSDGINSVLFGGIDGHIWELTLSPNGWLAWDLTASAGAPSIAAGTEIAPYIRADGKSAVVYRSPADGHLREIAQNGHGGWSPSDLTTVSVDPITERSVYVGNTGLSAVLYRKTSNQHIIELTSSFGAPWSASDLTIAAGAPQNAGKIAAYARNDQYNSVLSAFSSGGGPSAPIGELYRAFPSTQWTFSQIPATPAAPEADTGAALTGYVSNQCSALAACAGARLVNTVVYKAAATSSAPRHVIELELSNGSCPGGRQPCWQMQDLTMGTGAKLPKGGVSAFRRGKGNDNTSAIVYRGDDDHIWEIEELAGWISKDISL